MVRRPRNQTTIKLPRPRPLSGRYRLLVWLNTKMESRELPPSGEVIIGRGAEADLRIDTPSVSRRHARLIVESESVRLSDLGSRNGTRVNGEQRRRRGAPAGR